MKTLSVLLVISCAVFVCGCPGRTLNTGGKLVDVEGHTGSGIVFPEKINGFRRVNTIVYDEAGKDVSAGYNLEDFHNQIALTLYVYPGPRLVSIGSSDHVIETARRKLTYDHYEVIKAGVVHEHPKAVLSGERDLTMWFRGEHLYGRAAKFTYRQRFAHFPQEVISYAEVFAYGKWIIKFRITHPERTENKAQVAIDNFRRAFAEANIAK